MFRRLLAIFFTLSNLNASMILLEGDDFFKPVTAALTPIILIAWQSTSMKSYSITLTVPQMIRVQTRIYITQNKLFSIARCLKPASRGQFLMPLAVISAKRSFSKLFHFITK
jgi:hypothetical protein